VDVRKDVLDWIGGEFTSVTLDKDLGSVWLVKVNDEQAARAKVGAAIHFLSTQLGEIIAKKPALAPLAILSLQTSPAVDERLAGFENLQFAMSPRPAVWGVTDGCLVFGSSADAAALCLATARGDHPNVRSNARVMSEAIVPDGPFCSVSLTDQRKQGEDIAKGIGIASMVAGMLGVFVPDAEVQPIIAKIAGILSKLTPVARKIDFYQSTASSSTFDGQTWHTRGVTHYCSLEERATGPGHPSGRVP